MITPRLQVNDRLQEGNTTYIVRNVGPDSYSIERECDGILQSWRMKITHDDIDDGRLLVLPKEDLLYVLGYYDSGLSNDQDPLDGMIYGPFKRFNDAVESFKENAAATEFGKVFKLTKVAELASEIETITRVTPVIN